jgi:hypothetical protein
MDGLPAENEASQQTKRKYDSDTSLDAARETLASALRLRHRPLRDKLDNHNSKENPKKVTTSDNIDGMHLCKDQNNSSYDGDELPDYRLGHHRGDYPQKSPGGIDQVATKEGAAHKTT